MDDIELSRWEEEGGRASDPPPPTPGRITPERVVEAYKLVGLPAIRGQYVAVSESLQACGVCPYAADFLAGLPADERSAVLRDPFRLGEVAVRRRGHPASYVSGFVHGVDSPEAATASPFRDGEAFCDGQADGLAVLTALRAAGVLT